MQTVRFAVLSVIAAAATANAGMINATLNSISPSTNIRYSLSGSDYTGTTAGVFNWTRNSGDIPNPAGPTFSAFCIELTQNVSVNSSYNYNDTPLAGAPLPGGPYSPMGAALAAQIARILTVWANDVTGSANLRAAAAQAAIWETIFDTDNSLTDDAGNFFLDTNHTASNNVAIKANAYLVAQASAAPRTGLFALTSLTQQDMVVPAPGALALLGMGGLVAARRRRA